MADEVFMLYLFQKKKVIIWLAQVGDIAQGWGAPDNCLANG
jgi:hypothetical protein